MNFRGSLKEVTSQSALASSLQYLQDSDA